MRLVDLLRSRARAADTTGHGSPGSAFLREQDVAMLFTGKTGGGHMSGGAFGNKTGMGGQGDAGGQTVPFSPGIPGPVIAPDSGIEAEQLLTEWPDDPLEAYQDTAEFLEADRVHREVLAVLTEVYHDGMRGEPIPVERIVEQAMCLIGICGRSDTILRKAVRMKEGPISFPRHALDTAITAIKTGRARGYAGEHLFSLALCALLGDIGMTRVSPDILEKTGKLSLEEMDSIHEHVAAAVEIVSHAADRFPFLATVIGQIHERENGTGYPEGLAGDEIHEFARIIGMCDVYTALTEPKVNREKYSGFVALQQIISRRGEDFNPGVIKSLIEAIGIFPLESLVKLNNGLIGRVIGISCVHPTRPQLSVLANADGDRLTKPYLLDLEHEPLLYIEDPDIEEGAVLNP